MGVVEFYDQLGERYDLMTCDRDRWHTVGDQYRQLLERFTPRSILDAGCGSGGEALTLSELGYRVIGVDASPQMIQIARRKARESGTQADFRVDDLRELKSIVDEAVDMIICRGNTLPHLLTVEELTAAVQSFHRVAAPNCVLILQWLNYHPILRRRERLVGASGDERNLFLRFYDFKDETQVSFNIVALQFSDKWRSQWLTTALRPWLADDVGMLLVQNGWGDLEIASDLLGNDFDPDSSKDVVLLAVKR